MPQRNGQNPIRKVNNYGHSGNQFHGIPGGRSSGAAAGSCPACKAEVPPRPGFRFSALKCPKCGAFLGKK